MVNNNFLPEARYKKTYLDDVEANPLHHIGEIVHVKPFEFLKSQNTLYTTGENFIGIIRLEELTIYPIFFFEDRHIPRFLPPLFNHCITAKIIDYKDGKFILSRKESMKEALQYFKEGEVIDAYKTAFIRSSAYLDIGAGVEAICPRSELADCTNHLKYSTIQYLRVKLLSESQTHPNKFVASYKQLFPTKDIKEFDIIEGIASSWNSIHDGIYVEISPTQTGIANTNGLIVVEPDQLDEFEKPDVILGNSYTFFVKDITVSEKGSVHYHLSFAL